MRKTQTLIRLTASISAFAVVFSLTGCSFYGLFPVEHSYPWIGSDAAIKKADYSKVTAYDVSKNETKRALPSSGNVKTLVLPIEFSDFKFSDKNLSELNTAFNGSSEETGYWESVSSFYQKSSFGKVSLSSVVATPYDTGMKAKDYMSSPSTTAKKTVEALRKCVNKYKDSGHSTKDFDFDNDGFIDGVYLIYACPNYASSEGMGINLQSEYWAYTYWDFQGTASLTSPNARSYVWASVDFLHRGSENGVDAHTYIHETGHLFGLDDYYNYDYIDQNVNTDEKYRNFCPVGGFDMMDFNILDHNAFSKFSLGWSQPYVVTPDLEFPVTMELDDSSIAGQCLIIPDSDSKTSFNGTAYGEYLLVELYAPTQLNIQDSSNLYLDYPKGYSKPGVKIFHVDSRLYKNVGQHFSNYDEYPTLEELANSDPSSNYKIGASNTPSRSQTSGNRLLHLLESNGKLTFDKGEPRKYAVADNSTLFTPEEGRNSFTMQKFSSFFENGEYFNNGKPFDYSVKVNSIKTDNGVAKASITINKGL